MEKHYIAYTKEIAREKFYFVKSFISFPELEMAAPILSGYGMHKDFDVACQIAGIADALQRQQLKIQMQDTMPQAMVIDIKEGLQSKHMTL